MAKQNPVPIPETVRVRLAAMYEHDVGETCQLMRDAHGVPMSRQYLWQLIYDPERKGSLRMFARAVARLGLGDDECPIRASLIELYPDEFEPVNRQKLVRVEPRRRGRTKAA